MVQKPVLKLALTISAVLAGAALIAIMAPREGVTSTSTSTSTSDLLAGHTDPIYDQMAQACQGVGAAGRRSAAAPIDPTEPPESLRQYIRRLTVGDNGATFPYYSQGDLEKGGAYKMVIIMFHGATRDGYSYFCTATSSIKGNHVWKHDDVLVVAPDFVYSGDWLVQQNPNGKDLYWVPNLLDYRKGARSSLHFVDGSADPNPVSSFEVVDQMLRKLNNTALFPNLEMISLVGHSAGGQTVQRYALGTKLRPPITLGRNADPLEEREHQLAGFTIRGGIDLRFVIANPSSFAYMDNRRWAYSCDKSTQTCTSGNLMVPTAENAQFKTSDPQGKYFTALADGQGVTGDGGVPNVPYEVANPQGEFFCWDPEYNTWGYGIDGVGLSAADQQSSVYGYFDGVNMTDQALLYAYRNVWYLAGALDQCSPAMAWYNETGATNTNNNNGIAYDDACDFHHLDTRCPAMLQGPWRNYRTEHYVAYLYKYYGHKVHTLVTLAITQDANIVSNAGHDGSQIYTSLEGQGAIFSPVYQKQVFFQDPTDDEPTTI